MVSLTVLHSLIRHTLGILLIILPVTRGLPLMSAKPLDADVYDWISEAVENIKSNPETAEELMNDQEVLVGGDMLLSLDKNAMNQQWPNGDGDLSVPYDISPSIVTRMDDILTALNMISEKTCVSFHKRTTEEDYIQFKPGQGCASYVGWIGGGQPVFVGPYCRVGNVVHEVLHALGFYHEHTRNDRVSYIKIIFLNIMKGMEKNFWQREGDTQGLSYDIGSIMHYGSHYFSFNKGPTIISIKGESTEPMGQRSHLSDLDIERVRLLYKCGSRKEESREAEDVEPTVSHSAENNEPSSYSPGRDWPAFNNSTERDQPASNNSTERDQPASNNSPERDRPASNNSTERDQPASNNSTERDRPASNNSTGRDQPASNNSTERDQPASNNCPERDQPASNNSTERDQPASNNSTERDRPASNNSPERDRPASNNSPERDRPASNNSTERDRPASNNSTERDQPASIRRSERPASLQQLP